MVSRTSSSGTTPLNGLCVASQRRCASSHWYIGKWCTQQYASSSGSARPSRPPSSTRSRPSTSLVVSRAVGHDEDEVALLGPGLLAQRDLRRGGQELRDGAVELAARQDREVHEAPGAEALRQLRQVVDLAPGRLGHARRP